MRPVCLVIGAGAGIRVHLPYREGSQFLHLALSSQGSTSPTATRYRLPINATRASPFLSTRCELRNSQTTSPLDVTSIARPAVDSTMSVLPFERRCWEPQTGEKKDELGAFG